MPSVEQIEALLTDSPEDTFLLYALAMELDNEDKNDRSLTIFEKLMNQAPPYVPAFFMRAQQLVRLDRIADAKTDLGNGIQQAKEQDDAHAAREMTEFLASLD